MTEIIPTHQAFNPNVLAMRPSETLAMTARAKELRRQGRAVISLSAGEPDFDTPAAISEAGLQAIRDGFTHYTENAGMLELRQAICQKLERENGLSYKPEEVLCSNGAKQSVAQAVLALCRPGDEVIIPAPYWVSYPEMVVLAGASPVELPAPAEQGYRIRPEQLARAINENTRLLIMNSPSNPTGAVYTREELDALAEVLRVHNHVWVLSDEIYEHILFDAEHVAFAALEGMRDRTITVNGFSKAFAMTGWRLGYLAAPVEVTRMAAKVQSQFSSAPSSITQRAGIAALEMDMTPVREMVAAFRERRDFLMEALTRIPGLVCPKPEGAFYLFPRVSDYFDTRSPGGRTIETSEDLCYYLLDEFEVALVPGGAFGAPDGFRISYAASLADLEQAVDRIARGLAALKG